jgi:hypothetical protein
MALRAAKGCGGNWQGRRRRWPPFVAYARRSHGGLYGLSS